MSTAPVDLRQQAAREQFHAVMAPRAFYLTPADALGDVVTLLESARASWASEDDDVPELVMAINILTDLLGC